MCVCMYVCVVCVCVCARTPAHSTYQYIHKNVSAINNNKHKQKDKNSMTEKHILKTNNRRLHDLPHPHFSPKNTQRRIKLILLLMIANSVGA